MVLAISVRVRAPASAAVMRCKRRSRSTTRSWRSEADSETDPAEVGCPSKDCMEAPGADERSAGRTASTPLRSAPRMKKDLRRRPRRRRRRGPPGTPASLGSARFGDAKSAREDFSTASPPHERKADTSDARAR
ncbi:hypothetical protein BE21_01495 [Sorangium cellulosum]|uniref:Uncharacterized protein n=1 Tax=Sorangium cellulosum TaxID=56 RepID=A0A150TY26_SORCE|nr:hypothetical protein BE21_01495 [Sorangium cellulosum]